MSRVFVLSSDGQPLDPCHPARARRLLAQGKAAVWRYRPFAIRLKGRSAAASVTHPLRLKLDPGSVTTGLALMREEPARVEWAGELTHRGRQIRDALLSRAAIRRSRRQCKTRYRPARFLNRHRREGWLPPSLLHRVETNLTWVRRLHRLAPITALSVETVRFDTQALATPEISGVEYQQGELLGYEVREYLLDKWGRRCAYCGAAGVPLQVEHIVPRSRGGSDRVSNLTLACEPCNTKKGTRTAEEFGHPTIQAQARLPLGDAAAVNTTRWALYQRLVTTGLPVEVGTGGRTKFNRARLGLPKAHWLDAACVGASTPDTLDVRGIHPLLIRATGRGSRQVCRTNSSGFPIRHKPRARCFQGWQTGDLVRASLPTGKYAGRHTGRIAIRFRPSFRLGGRIDVHPKYLIRLQRADGYDYAYPHTAPGASPAS